MYRVIEKYGQTNSPQATAHFREKRQNIRPYWEKEVFAEGPKTLFQGTVDRYHIEKSTGAAETARTRQANETGEETQSPGYEGIRAI